MLLHVYDCMNKEKNVWKSGQARGRTGVRPLVVAIIATVASVFSIQPAGATGETARVVVAGRQVLLPFGVCRSRDGELLLTQPRCRTVFGVNPTTGAIRIVSTGGILGIPNGIAAEQSGAILVANGVELIRVDALTGAQHVVSAGGLFKAPIGVAIAADNFIYVADAAG